jgi:hypothetical protein
MPTDPTGKVVRNIFALRKYENGLAREVAAQFERSAERLKRILLRMDPTSVSAGRVKARLRRLYRAADEALKQLYSQVNDISVDGLLGLASVESEFAAGILEDAVGASVDIETQRIGRTFARSIVTTDPIQGQVMRDWWKTQKASTATAFRTQVQLGLSQNETIDQIVRRVRGRSVGGGRFVGGIMQTSTRKAEALVRTAANEVANKAHYETYAANKDVTQKYELVVTFDSRTSDICVVGTTNVTPVGRTERLFKRPHKGEMLVITTASGKQLKGTPNHPVLTAHGWLPLNELQPGKHILYAPALEGLCVDCCEDIGMPAVFSEVADALLQPAPEEVLAVRAPATEFDTDRQGFDGEVHIANTEGFLRRCDDASIGEKAEEGALGGSHTPAYLQCGGPLDHLGMGQGLADVATEIDAGPSEAAVEPVLRPGPAETLEDIGRPRPILEHGDGNPFVLEDCIVPNSALEPWHSTQLFEQTRNSGGGGFVLPCQRCGRSSVSVEPENIVSVRCELFSGHVYNLQTCREIYIANGLIVHNCISLDGKTYAYDDPNRKMPPFHFNCRTTIAPIVDWEGLGIEPPPEFKRAAQGGPVPASSRYSDWLKGQDIKTQNQILGRGRAQLWREGKLDLSNLVRADGSSITLGELEQRLNG